MVVGHLVSQHEGRLDKQIVNRGTEQSDLCNKFSLCVCLFNWEENDPRRKNNLPPKAQSIHRVLP